MYDFVEKPEEKRPLERRRRRWENNNKIDFEDMGREGRDWIDLA
jgi:hypothetical protein